uniref:Uncharacterized protein n=1 Tax=Cryptomonas curvata TaxID=233186 RepID=A0A7S0LYX0_9CRYP
MYVAAAGPDDGFGRVSDCDVEIWLGDGAGAVELVETVAVRGAGANWVYLGVLRVAPAGIATCAGHVQAGAGTCYVWFSGGGAPAAYPLSFPFRAQTVALRPQPVNGNCAALSSLSYRVDAGAGCGGCGECGNQVPAHSGALGPFISAAVLVDGRYICLPDEMDPRHLDMWLGFDQTTSTLRWIGYTLTINGPGFVEGKLKMNFSRAAARRVEDGFKEDVCVASRIDEPPVEVVADAALAKLALSVRHSQVKVGNYLLAAVAAQVEEIRSVVAKVYVGGSCSCWDSKLLLQGLGSCSFTGPVLGGSTGAGIALANSSWTVAADGISAFLELTTLTTSGGAQLCEGVYWVLLESPHFFPRVVRVILGAGGSGSPARATLVRRPCSLCVRVVLEWGSVADGPADLDLRVLDISPQLPPPPAARWRPEGCQDSREVYWASPGPKFGGVSLDVDFTAGFGPETATFAAGVVDGAYHVAVSVYTAGDEADPAVLGGRASVAVYGAGGLLALEAPPLAVWGARAWWVGTLTRTRAGYTYATVGNATAKFDRCQVGEAVDCTTQCSSL